MKNSFYIDLQRFMLIPTKFPLTRYSRNPMLSGTLVYYLGIITILCSWQAVLIFVVVVFIMMVQVHNEEQRLERDFGDEYRNYKHKVGKFFPKL